MLRPRRRPLRARKQPSPDVEEAIHRYTSLIFKNIETMWYRGMPRAANDPWLKAAQVTVRFAILPDGSMDTPRVTVSSGRDSYDGHALQAIYKTAPFPPLPQGVTVALPICINFRYHSGPAQHETKPVDLWPPPQKPAS